MKKHFFVSSLTIASLVASAGATGPVGSAQELALAEFRGLNSQAGLYYTDDAITTIYGPAFAFGDSPKESAASFISQHAGLFAVEAGDLVEGSLAGDGAHLREKMLNKETGKAKFTLVSYLQAKDGIPVFRSDLRLLVRNEIGHPLVLAESALKDLGDFQVPNNAGAMPAVLAAQNTAALKYMGMVNFTEPTQVIWAGYSSVKAAEPRLAVTFIGTAFDPFDARYQKRLFVADAQTGDILYDENQVSHIDVTGSIKGLATPGKKADICETELSVPLPYARASIGATVAFADKNGNFVIPNAGNTPVTVNSELAGQFFRTHLGTSGGAVAEAQSLANVTPPGPANFVFNAANTNATFRSGVNAYVEANRVRDFALKYFPTYPVIGGQTNWPVNINVAGTCNAFYDGSSINFYPAGGGCPSTAFGDVVWHEYGHHLVSVAGSGQGQYGEGMGDTVGVLISDEPVLGYGFLNNCAAGIRTAVNTIQYPCAGEIHDCGQLISGAVWETRNELLITNPSTYKDIIGDLTINSIDLHTGTEITPAITVHFLTLDDDDANIGNGTPHYQEIAKGFGEHNLDAPPLALLSFTYPAGKPTLATPNQPTPFPVNIAGQAGTPIAGTAVLFYKINNGSFISAPMTQGAPNQYTATLPATACGDTFTWYIRANANPGNVFVFDPIDAPATTYTTLSATGVTNVFTDDMQANKGWTGGVAGDTATTGIWNRMDPQPTLAQPGDDHTPGAGTICWVTDGNAGASIGANDVDSGKTTLLSPVIDLSGKSDATISYWRWFSNDQGSNPGIETFSVDISNNNGTTWTNVEVVPANQGTGGWVFKSFNVATKVTPTAQVRVRFVAKDDIASIVEAAVDDFNVDAAECATACYPDCDSSGGLSIDDFICFQTLFALGNLDADCDQSGSLSIDDFICFQTFFAIGC